MFWLSHIVVNLRQICMDHLSQLRRLGWSTSSTYSLWVRCVYIDVGSDKFWKIVDEIRCILIVRRLADRALTAFWKGER